MPFSNPQTRIMKVLKYYLKLFTTAFRHVILKPILIPINLAPNIKNFPVYSVTWSVNPFNPKLSI